MIIIAVPDLFAAVRDDIGRSASILLLTAFGLLLVNGIIGVFAAGIGAAVRYFSRPSRLRRRLYFLANRRRHLQMIGAVKLTQLRYFHRNRLKRLQPYRRKR